MKLINLSKKTFRWKNHVAKPTSERRLHKMAEKLRIFAREHRFYTKIRLHDDVNLVELYCDCESDQRFIDHFTLPWKEVCEKYNMVYFPEPS